MESPKLLRLGCPHKTLAALWKRFRMRSKITYLVAFCFAGFDIGGDNVFNHCFIIVESGQE
jgi:hypothetical protein